MKLIQKYLLGTPKEGSFAPNGKYSPDGRLYEIWKKDINEAAARAAVDKNELIGPAKYVPQLLLDYYRDKEDTRRFMERKRANELLTDKMMSRVLDVATLWNPATKAATWTGRIATKGIKSLAGLFTKSATPKVATTAAETASRAFTHPAEVVVSGARRPYTSPQSSGWADVYTRDPIMNSGKSSTRLIPVLIVELPVELSRNILTNPRNLIREGGLDGYLLISIDDVLRLAQERLGRKLTKTELKDYIGSTRDPFAADGRMETYDIINPDESKIGIEFKEENLEEALANLEKFVSPNTLRTRYGNEVPYRLEELVNNGKLRPNVALLRTYPGEHGKVNWFDKEDNALTRVLKYVNTQYNPNRFKIGKEIVAENPYDRSGVIIGGTDYDFSIDSFESALNYIRKALNKGRKFSPLRANKVTYKIENGQIMPITHIKSNHYGQIKRYNEEFSDELINAIKLNNGVLPDYVKVALDELGNFRLYSQQNGFTKSLGKLTPRSNESIIQEYTNMIDNLNKQYNLNIGYPRINPKTNKIEWPNIFGVLYKNGGKFSDFIKNFNYVYKNI